MIDTGIRCGAPPCSSTRCIPHLRPPLHLASRKGVVVQVRRNTTSWTPTSTAEPDRRRAAIAPADPAPSARIGTSPDDFPGSAELRAEGRTDYRGVPLVFTDCTVHVATWSTAAAGGFTPRSLPVSNRSSRR
jgi:hypothetical protein